MTVFSDGRDDELADLLAMPSIQRAAPNCDIVDLFLLSRTGLVVASAGSTFGYWPGLLADSPLILHPDHIHAPSRPDDINERFYEGGPGQHAEAWPILLKQNISTL